MCRTNETDSKGIRNTLNLGRGGYIKNTHGFVSKSNEFPHPPRQVLTVSPRSQHRRDAALGSLPIHRKDRHEKTNQDMACLCKANSFLLLPQPNPIKMGRVQRGKLTNDESAFLLIDSLQKQMACAFHDGPEKPLLSRLHRLGEGTPLI